MSQTPDAQRLADVQAAITRTEATLVALRTEAQRLAVQLACETLPGHVPPVPRQGTCHACGRTLSRTAVRDGAQYCRHCVGRHRKPSTTTVPQASRWPHFAGQRYDGKLSGWAGVQKVW